MDEAEQYFRRAAQIRKKTFGPSGFTVKSFKRLNEAGGSGEDPPSVSSTTSRVSLIEKWFPGNMLKMTTIEPSCAPSTSFVRETMERITQLRERMLQLRSGIEDIDKELAAVGALQIDSSNVDLLLNLQNFLNQFVCFPCKKRKTNHQQLIEYQRIKSSVNAPVRPNSTEWHKFLNEFGPETPHLPLVSYFLWCSSASITLLFTILIQRFLKRFDSALHNEKNNSSGLSKEDPLSIARSSELPENSCSNSDSFHELLIFLRLFMPLRPCEGTEGSQMHSGYSLWLFSCLAFLDTPLDPDTDRLASNLFRKCCDQVRAIGRLKQTTGNQQGLLLQSLSEQRKDIVFPKEYRSSDDVGEEELSALYSLIIILSKIFRQNQNRLIPLP